MTVTMPQVKEKIQLKYHQLEQRICTGIISKSNEIALGSKKLTDNGDLGLLARNTSANGSLTSKSSA